MRIVAFDGIGRPVVIDVTRVVVQTDDGTPIMAAVADRGGEIHCNHVGDGPAFERLLADFGIRQTVVVEHIRVPTVEDFKI